MMHFSCVQNHPSNPGGDVSTKYPHDQKGLNSKPAMDFSLLDKLLDSKANPGSNRSGIQGQSRKSNTYAPKRAIPLIDRLKDYKVSNMWESACKSFGEAVKSNNLELRWQTFHIKCLFECLGNSFRWDEIQHAWKIVTGIKQSVHTLLDDDIMNVVLNVVAIKNPGLQISRDYKMEPQLVHLSPTSNSIESIFHDGARCVHSELQADTKLSTEPLFLQVYDEMQKRQFTVDQYGSRGFIIGTARMGMWALAAQMMGQASGKYFSPPKVPNFDFSSENRSTKATYDISEIEIAEIIQASQSRDLLKQILAQRYPKEFETNSIPTKILSAAVKVEKSWLNGLSLLTQNSHSMADAGLINLAVSVAYRGSSSPETVQRVLDFYVKRALNPSDFPRVNTFPMIALAKNLTKSYEMVVQCHARSGNWEKALEQFYESQRCKVPCSTDLHGSILRALNKSSRHVDIINSFLLVKDKDVNPTGKKSILKTISLINAFTSYKLRRR